MNNLWIYLSFLVMFTTAFSLILLKILNNTKLNIIILLGLGYIIAALFSITYMIYNKNEFKYTINNLSVFVLSLIFIFVILHICSQNILSKAIVLAPNTSYCHLIINLNIIVTLLISYFLFNEKINIMTLFGIIITLLGICIVIHYSDK